MMKRSFFLRLLIVGKVLASVVDAMKLISEPRNKSCDSEEVALNPLIHSPHISSSSWEPKASPVIVSIPNSPFEAFPTCCHSPLLESAPCKNQNLKKLECSSQKTKGMSWLLDMEKLVP
jgi:hypothetical protein